MKLLIAGGCRASRDRLATVLGLESGFEVSTDVADLGRTVELACRIRPAVVVIDVDDARISALTAARDVGSMDNAPVVIILAVRLEADLRVEARDAGVACCIEKSEGIDRLIEEIRRADHG